MDDQKLSRLHAIVEGRVQGVSFRYFVSEQASYLGVNGWVRNRMDGSVEVMTEGPRNQLELLLQQLHKGPPMAHVSDVQVEWLEGTGEFGTFWVRSTV
jgi:acylphosphatase